MTYLSRCGVVMVLGCVLVACGSEDAETGQLAVHKSESQSVERMEAFADPGGSSVVPGSLAAYDVTGIHEFEPVPATELEPGPEHDGELRNLLNVGYVLSGLRGQVDDGSLTRLQLKSIGIESDGSWDPMGATYGDFARTDADDSENSFQAALETSKPSVIVGIGLGMAEDKLTALQIVTREHSPEARGLVGEELVQTRPYDEKDIQVAFSTSDVVTDSDALDHTYIVGLGMVKLGNEPAKLRVWTASLELE